MHLVSYASNRSARPYDLAVLVNEFPKLSETFVLHDLLSLESSGVRLKVFSLRRPQAELAHEATTQLRADVQYIPEIKGRQLRLLLRTARALLFIRDPPRYLRGMARIYTSPDYSRLRLDQALVLAAELERSGCPPLYIHFAHKPGTVGRFASLLLGTPYGISAHAVDVWTSPPKELRAKFRDAQTVLCCYEESRDYVRRLAKGHTSVQLVHHGVDVPPTPERREASPPALLSVGRLVEKKGYDTLLRAAALLRRRGLEFEVRIVGEGPLWPTLQRLVHELDLGYAVRFLGPLTDRELEEQYAAATMFVLLCQTTPDGNRDGLPNTLLEAMARGIPVVSTTLPSVAEAIDDGEQGMLVPPRDETALADVLALLLNDPDLRARLGESGRERVAERYDRKLLAPLVFEALTGGGLLGRGRA